MPAAETYAIVSFGEWVRQRRLALALTRPALAKRIGCSSSTIKKLERDERRPSRELAALLADHLLIPPREREHFIRMARGEYLSVPLSPPALISGLARPWPEAEATAAGAPRLVARDLELAELAWHLDRARSGHGAILFITGEAGDGKSVLAEAFARQSLAGDGDLIVATGNCSAYTGVGDPYLPFRELLELLTGDIEPHRDASVVSPTHAARLLRLVPHMIEALLNFGPDLIDTFILGTPLLNRAEAALSSSHQGLLERLQLLVDRHQRSQATAHLHQSNLIAQCTRVLQSLARRQPLLLIIDDLQWADVGSINLLFHLSRHLYGHRILLVGIYRAAEVALGRQGVRHPLEPVLNELQRTFGGIQIRLNQTSGREFVDALIDSEANRLDRAFRDALYRQTAGHPLFTVEMLHGLQARGDLVRDAAGAWSASPSLDWDILPARVEGIIKERIGRLAPGLQELLQVASVAGETFYAETVAAVLASDAQQVIGRLGAVLAREQRLVIGQGSQQVGALHLSQYRFRHILFQQYLYNSLDGGQRAHYHRTLAQELERCYGPESRFIAPQLAHHYVRAGVFDRARYYFTLAGDAAAAVYANAEAERHYRQALELSQESHGDPAAVPRQMHRLYMRLGRILELSARHDEAVACYEEMERTATAYDEPAMVLASLLARAAIRTTVNFARDPVEGRALLQQAQALALELGDQAAEARILWNLLILSTYTGEDAHERLDYGEKSLALARQLELPEQLAFTLHDLFYAYAGSDRWDQARASLDEAREHWQRLENLPMLSEACMRLHWVHLATGDYDAATELADEAYRLGIESHNVDAQALSHFMLGFVYWERGQLDRALTTMKEDVAVATTVNSLTPLTGTRADLGLLYGELGDAARGLELATLARTTAEEQLPILRFWPHAAQILLLLRRGDVAAAEPLVRTLADYRTVKARFGYMPFMWTRVGLAHGEYALQRRAFGEAATLMASLAADMAVADIWYLRPDVLHLQGRALLGLGSAHWDEAHQTLQAARDAAEALGSQRALWAVLRSLAQLAAVRGDGEAAAGLRQAADTIVARIAAEIGEPDLRAGFRAACA